MLAQQAEIHQKIIRETAEFTKVQDELANQRTEFCSKRGNGTA